MAEGSIRLSLVVAELCYQVVLVAFAIVASIPAVGSARQWGKVYYAALAGMLLEVLFIVAVK